VLLTTKNLLLLKEEFFNHLKQWLPEFYDLALAIIFQKPRPEKFRLKKG
jgi:hypothetical protein